MGKALIIKEGEKSGQWTYTGKWEYRGKIKYLKCICECGVVGYLTPSNFRRPDKYNMCYACAKITHHMSSSRLYVIWDKMKQRCMNPKHTAYSNYGGRGIKILWKSFEDFYDDMSPSYRGHVESFGEKNTTLDRIDNNGNYCKENCKRSTRAEQNRNQRRTYHLEYKGKMYTSLTELCEDVNANYLLVKDRIRRGRDLDKAIDTPLLRNKKQPK